MGYLGGILASWIPNYWESRISLPLKFLFSPFHPHLLFYSLSFTLYPFFLCFLFTPPRQQCFWFLYIHEIKIWSCVFFFPDHYCIVIKSLLIVIFKHFYNILLLINLCVCNLYLIFRLSVHFLRYSWLIFIIHFVSAIK